MKNLAMLLLSLAALIIVVPSSTFAQTRPDVEVVKFSWRKLRGASAPSGKKAQEARIAQINAAISSEYEKDYRDRDHGAIQRGREEQLRLRRNQITIDSFSPPNRAYEYKFKFKNHSEKQVTTLFWTYLFIDPVSGKELVRHRFGSQTQLAPGKQQGLTAYTDSSPPKVVNAEAIKKIGGKGWNEVVIIEKIEFSDGSKWERSGA